MKKLIIVIITSILIAGCSVQNNHTSYDSFICDTANDGSGIASEISCWTGLYFTKNNMPKKSCAVSGNKYVGSYDNSITDKLNSYETDIYSNEKGITFGLRSDTGELVLLNLMNAEFFDTEPYLPDVSKPEETAISMATEIASKYVNDISEYTRIIEEPRILQKEKDGKIYTLTSYITTFARKIGEHFTSDYISVKVTSKGNLASIIIGDLNAFDDISFECDDTALNESVTSKIDKIYQPLGISIESKNTTYQRIAKTPQGEICMYSVVKLEGLDTSKTDYHTALPIITFLPYKETDN